MNDQAPWKPSMKQRIFTILNRCDHDMLLVIAMGSVTAYYIIETIITLYSVAYSLIMFVWGFI